MPSISESSKQPPPSPEEIDALRRLVAGIVRAQGNRFIKELLRELRIRIGSNKEEFDRNMAEAIESGQLRLSDVEVWLQQVEGWGDQHVYLFEFPWSAQRHLTESVLRGRLRDLGLETHWGANPAMDFPAELQLSSIGYADRGGNRVLSILWQKAATSRVRAKEHDRIGQTIGLDTFDFDCYRRLEERAIARFEASGDSNLAAIFVPDPIKADAHTETMDLVEDLLEELGVWDAIEDNRLDIPTVLKNMDQQNMPNNRRQTPKVTTQRSKLVSGGASVEFASNSDRPYWDEEAVQKVRQSVKNAQLAFFRGADGVFTVRVTNGKGLVRPVRVALHGDDNRIRLRAQMDAAEVWNLLRELAAYK